MNMKSLLGAAAMAILTASTAFAATFTIDDVDYEITTVVGSYTSLKADVEAQAWWGNPKLAYRSAETVSTSLGMSAIPGTSFIGGPVFAWTFDSMANRLFSSLKTQFFSPSTGAVVISTVGERLLRPDEEATFALVAQVSAAKLPLVAQVSAVPLPAGGLFLLSGLVGVAALKRRKNRAA